MTDIPATGTFFRYATKKHLSVGDDGTVSISSSNFLLRQERKEWYLSGGWYELLKPESYEDGLRKAVKFIQEQGFNKVNGAFSLHTVSHILAASDNDIAFKVCQLQSSGPYSGIMPQPKLISLYHAEQLAQTISKILAV